MSAADIRPTCPKCRGTGRVDEDAPVGGLDEMLAAAEERGRRRGVEERDARIAELERNWKDTGDAAVQAARQRDEWKRAAENHAVDASRFEALLKRARRDLYQALARTRAGNREIEWDHTLADIDAALAPRDSGKGET